jgi:hypothetical protein
MILNNPFSDFGSTVTEERFVGRQSELKQINNRLFGNSFGNLAIMGLPRIGKSSLAWNGIITNKKTLLENKIIPLWIQLGEFSNLSEFFDEVLTQTTEVIEENFPNLNLYDNFKSLMDSFINAEKNIEKRRYVKKYLKSLKDNKIRLIVVIDEFDNAKDIFNLQDFQFLREISYNIEIKICIVTISRKTIQELEPDNGSLSNFYQIFDELRLKLFSDEDLVLYRERISKLGLTISESYINHLLYYSGKHPFLLDMINYSVFNQIEQSEINLDEIFSKILENLKLRLYNEYESIINLMKQEELDSKLAQLIVGPQYNLTQRDVEKLLKYSLVSNSDNNSYECFAKYFEEYLFLKASEIDIWPLWKETEVEIRTIIKQFLNEKYGETDWENKFVKGNPNKTDKIEALKLMKSKNIKSFGDKASTHIVDYTYPYDMFDCFIHSDWSWFKKILGKEFKDWKPKFDVLSKARNPIAHNNQGFLTQSELNSATAYCQEILSLIQKWKKN